MADFDLATDPDLAAFEEPPAAPAGAAANGKAGAPPKVVPPIRPRVPASAILPGRAWAAAPAAAAPGDAWAHASGDGEWASSAASSKYKTTLCRHWAMTRSCSAGDACHFAHGQEELRRPPDGWYSQPGWPSHPVMVPPKKAETLARPRPFAVHIDELAMPGRPPVGVVRPSPHDREVFFDTFPGDDGGPGVEEFAKGFGEVDSACRIPGKECGYVRFCTHAAAAACVASGAGSWSESERAISGFKSTRTGVLFCAYPDSLLDLLLGADADATLRQLESHSRVVGLRAAAGAVAAAGAAPGDAPGEVGQGAPERLRFTGRGTEAQEEALRQKLEEQLADAHAAILQLLETAQPREVLVRGLPTAWSKEEVEPLFVPFGNMESFALLGAGFAHVVYEEAADAARAALDLGGMQVAGEDSEALLCELMLPDCAEDFRPQRLGTAHVGNLPYDAQEGDVRQFFERVGPVAAVWRAAQKRDECFVGFASSSDARRAIEAPAELWGRRLQVSWADPAGVGVLDPASARQGARARRRNGASGGQGREPSGRDEPAGEQDGDGAAPAAREGVTPPAPPAPKALRPTAPAARPVAATSKAGPRAPAPPPTAPPAWLMAPKAPARVPPRPRPAPTPLQARPALPPRPRATFVPKALKGEAADGDEAPAATPAAAPASAWPSARPSAAGGAAPRRIPPPGAPRQEVEEDVEEEDVVEEEGVMEEDVVEEEAAEEEAVEDEALADEVEEQEAQTGELLEDELAAEERVPPKEVLTPKRLGKERGDSPLARARRARGGGGGPEPGPRRRVQVEAPEPVPRRRIQVEVPEPGPRRRIQAFNAFGAGAQAEAKSTSDDDELWEEEDVSEPQKRPRYRR